MAGFMTHDHPTMKGDLASRQDHLGLHQHPGFHPRGGLLLTRETRQATTKDPTLFTVEFKVVKDEDKTDRLTMGTRKQMDEVAEVMRQKIKISDLRTNRVIRDKLKQLREKRRADSDGTIPASVDPEMSPGPIEPTTLSAISDKSDKTPHGDKSVGSVGNTPPPAELSDLKEQKLKDRLHGQSLSEVEGDNVSVEYLNSDLSEVTGDATEERTPVGDITKTQTKQEQADHSTVIDAGVNYPEYGEDSGVEDDEYSDFAEYSHLLEDVDLDGGDESYKKKGKQLAEMSEEYSYEDYVYEDLYDSETGFIKVPYNFSGLHFGGLSKPAVAWDARQSFLTEVASKLWMFVPAAAGGVVIGLMLWFTTVLVIRTYGVARKSLGRGKNTEHDREMENRKPQTWDSLDAIGTAPSGASPDSNPQHIVSTNPSRTPHPRGGEGKFSGTTFREPPVSPVVEVHKNEKAECSGEQDSMSDCGNTSLKGKIEKPDGSDCSSGIGGSEVSSRLEESLSGSNRTMDRNSENNFTAGQRDSQSETTSGQASNEGDTSVCEEPCTVTAESGAVGDKLPSNSVASAAVGAESLPHLTEPSAASADCSESRAKLPFAVVKVETEKTGTPNKLRPGQP